MEFKDFYKEKSAREVLREWGFDESVLSGWTDEECEENLQSVIDYPQG